MGPLFLVSALSFLWLLAQYSEVADLNADLKLKVRQIKRLVKEQAQEKKQAWLVSERKKVLRRTR